MVNSKDNHQFDHLLEQYYYIMANLKLYPEHPGAEKTVAILQPPPVFASHISRLAKDFKEYIESEFEKRKTIDTTFDEETLPECCRNIMPEILREYESKIKPEVEK